MPRGSIERTFEYVDVHGDIVSLEVNFEFTYKRGTRRSNPFCHYNSSIGSWDPPDDPEWEIENVTRQTSDGQYVPVSEADWLWSAWVMPTWEALTVTDFEDAMGVS